MFNAFLNYEQMQEYIALLTENDLLSYDRETRTFRTTKKGLLFLQAYNQMDQILKEHKC
jgi:predicted transcriptional regulator